MYEPKDFFESLYEYADAAFDLLLREGNAVAILRVPRDPIDEALHKRIETYIINLLLVRQFQTHRRFALQESAIRQSGGGGARVEIRVGDSESVAVRDLRDLIASDISGTTVSDSEAERITDSAMLHVLAPQLSSSPAVRSLFEAYSRSVNDPDDELVHLYEVRDILSQHYGGKKKACDVLGISDDQWRRVGELANDVPLSQGRHRGKHRDQLRTASASELREARQIVQCWMLAFVRITGGSPAGTVRIDDR